ncbi:MAG TPA: hypothetical protein VKU00_31195 [Chthonomonadaceae bacterium]|nr:hypothetical protein [Chthonomonadaceae bacterium]
MNRSLSLIATALVLVSVTRPVLGQTGPIHLSVDATEAPRKILHARLSLPVAPGPLTLLYPKWIPGEHSPDGPIANLVNVRLTTGGHPLAWRRDDVNMYAIRCSVPHGASTLEASYDFLIPPSQGPFAQGPSATTELAVLNWNLVTLYPAGYRSDDLSYEARLKLPAGWKWATSLPVASTSNNEITFKPASLTTLVDSPLITGKHFRAVPLGTDRGRPHELDIVADSDAALEAPASVLDSYKRLVPETGVIFGVRHYRQYRFLLTLSDHTGFFGEEHHESSDDRQPERTLLDDSLRKGGAIVLPHEFFHSWNGKYRRPAGLATPDYDEPMKDELLWVYEGLTDYYGAVLAARIGLFSPEDFRDYLASIVSQMEATTGRNWRPLADTAIAAPVLYAAPQEWGTARRGTDFYPEMDLIWLEADTIIRRQTNGQRSLDDFCRLFHGGESTPPMVKPYTEDDVVSALNTVAPYDWRGFFDSRIYKINPHAPLGGIEGSGWKMVYTETPNALIQANEQSGRGADFTDTLGLLIGGNGAISDIIAGRPADKAGMSPGQLITAVSGRKYSADLLHAAVKASRSNTAPIELLVQDGEYFHTYKLDYHGGERYPHLERDASKPDLLSLIAQARAK